MRPKYVKIEKCVECKFPTKDRFRPIPLGDATIALCKICQKRIPRQPSEIEILLEEDARIERRRRR